MAIAEDLSAPPVATRTGAGSLTTASFAPPAGSLLVAMVSSAFATSGNSTVVSLTDSGGHTWTQGVLEQDPRNGANNSGGTVAIFYTYLATAPGAITCTMTATNMGGGASLAIKVLTGAAPQQAGATARAEFGATTNVTTGSLAITTTQSGSIVYGVAADGEVGGTLTLNGSSILINSYRDTTDVVTIVDLKSGVTSLPGSVTLGGTWSAATDSRIALFEVIPAPPPPPSTTGTVIYGAGTPQPVLARPPFRLSVANTTTGQIVGDLPISGVQVPTWSRQLSAPGSLEVTVANELDSDMRQRLNEPWRWTIVYSYGNFVCQAGMLEYCDVDDSQQPPVYRIRTSSMWAFLAKKRLVYTPAASGVFLPANNVVFGSNSPDPANTALSLHSVARRIVELATTGPYRGLPIVLPTPIPGSSTITYLGSDLAYVGQRLDDIVKMANAPEIEFSPEWTDGTNRAIRWRMRIGNSRLGQLGYPHAWDYQRACSFLRVTTDGADMSFYTATKGQFTQTSQAYGDSNSLTTPYPAQGWPMLESGDTSHASETLAANLQGYATADVQTHQLPALTGAATFRVTGKAISGQPTRSPSLDLVAVGDTGVVQVQSHPSLSPGQYGVRVLSMGSGKDLWTWSSDLQILGLIGATQQ